MSDHLYRYYERELLFIRQLSGGFAEKYPAAASRLRLDANRSVDPHVERLIEAFSLLSARVHQKIDDDFPELTDALLNVLYPHYLAPIPSMAVVELEPELTNIQPTGLEVPRHSRLRSQKHSGLPCRFRTCYPVTLWPLTLVDAQLQGPPFDAALNPPPATAAALKLEFQVENDLALSDLTLDSLRLYLGSDSQLTAQLYELIFNHALQVEFSSPAREATRPPVVFKPNECLKQVGFRPDEGLLPYPNQSFLGYRLLTEFFTFPEKFFFVDIEGWRRVAQAGFGSRVELVIYLDESVAALEQEVCRNTFRLGCTPIVNLFEKVSEPVRLTHEKFEYRVIPDVQFPTETEVYSIDGVTSADPNQTRNYQPFYALRHDGHWQEQRDEQAYWYASRQPSNSTRDRGTEVFLHLVDLNFNPRLPAEAAVVVRSTCTNRDLPSRLQNSGVHLNFVLEAALPVQRINCLRQPTEALRPPHKRNAHWRLMSHLKLNHLSISDPIEAKATLQEILRLYDFSDEQSGQRLAAVNRQAIEGILSVSSRRVVGRIGESNIGGFCRGVEVAIELDEQKYLGVGAYLFACVLERFLNLYVSINSFTQLVAKTKKSDRTFKKWAPREGEVLTL